MRPHTKIQLVTQWTLPSAGSLVDVDVDRNVMECLPAAPGPAILSMHALRAAHCSVIMKSRRLHDIYVMF